MSLSGHPQNDPNNARLVAAVVAAIQAYMEFDVRGEPRSPRISAWVNEARSWQVGDHFGRQISWSGID